MNILITICARGGSKGIPGKNIKLLNGKPLIAYTIDQASKFATIFPADITLSTDSLDIKQVAALAGLENDYIRPAELATDTVGKIPVLADILNYEEKTRNKTYDFLLDLDVSAPMRSLQDLIEGFKIIRNNQEALNLFSVSNAHKNPYFNMVEENENGFFELCKKLPNGVLSRQQAPKVYEMNASFYFYTKKFFDEQHKGAVTSKSLIYPMEHQCFDLDQPADFVYLDFLVSNNKLDFEI